MGIKVSIGSAFYEAGFRGIVSRDDFNELIADPNLGMKASVTQPNRYVSEDGNVVAFVGRAGDRTRCMVRTNIAVQVLPA